MTLAQHTMRSILSLLTMGRGDDTSPGRHGHRLAFRDGAREIFRSARKRQRQARKRQRGAQ